MSSIITCQCGAKIRVPEGQAAKGFRCPKCKAEILVSATAGILVSTVATGDKAGGTCPICQTAIGPAEAVVTCPECRQVHHKDCWTEVGGCSTYGCAKAPEATKEGPSSPVPLAAWGDTKRCPACGETIKAIALRCRFCGEDFETVDPLTVRDLSRQVNQQVKRGALQNGVIALFAVSLLLGCLAPITLMVALGVVLPNRKALARSGPFYVLLGYSAIGLSALYSILLLLFFLFSRGS
jgi:hypothetical protein